MPRKAKRKSKTGSDIRERFLRYFERHGHTRVRSSPLLPANDPTLLFTNAGMNQFKDTFLGLEKRDYVRACSSQKCVRAGGKHNDLDEVGKTARHHTFFEMLGNFSFGDYFKEEAIKFAWDLLVDEFKLDPARMWFSVFGGDEEVAADEDAEKFWAQVGAPRERILRFGRKDNFWQMADTGPCGPCSEIHYYMGPDPDDAENCAANVNGPGDTITEIWNLVFMQFDRSEVEPGKYTLAALPAPSVDTGLGLERITAVLQDVKSNYETDLLKDIVEFTAKLADRNYEPETQAGFAMCVIADHARATAFSVADGILPSGGGDRGSVLRKIIRRAIYQGRHTLGFDGLFFNEVTNFVVDQMKEAYPELESQRDFIEKMVRLEEERFGSTLTVGLQKLETVIPQIRQALELSNVTFMARMAVAEESFRPVGEALSKINEVSMEKLRPLANLIQALREMDRSINPSANAILIRNAFAKVTLAPEAEALASVSPDLRGNVERVLNALSHINMDSGEAIKQAFNHLARLYDTFGTPRDLVRIGLEDHGISLSEEQFNDDFDDAMHRIQKNQQITQVVTGTSTVSGQRNLEIPTVTAKGDPSVAVQFMAGPYTRALQDLGKADFVGYTTTRVKDARVTRLFNGKLGVELQTLEVLTEGDEGEVALDRTPFYAESGGQVGDVGVLASNSATAVVRDTYSPTQGLIIHKVKVEKGTLKVGDVVSAEVDVEKRDATRRNHTATHLMHAALREVLGTHVKQAGSVVAPNYLRFDFTHYQPLTDDEIEEIERLVNYHILRNEPVQTSEMAVEEAMRSGAMALFGEKYGAKVRVLSINGAEGIFSKELCGGTHVRATGDIGVFKIVSDESIASGVRRIRAVTGVDAYERFRDDELLIDQVASNLRTSRAELPAVIGKLQDELKKARREADELRLKIASGAVGNASANGDEAREVAGVRVLAREASGLDAAGLRQLSDTLLARIKSGVVVLGRSGDGKASLIVRTSSDLSSKVPAGQVIKELAPIIGGKGGGKPDMAEGGGNQPEKLADALAASYGVIEKLLSKQS